MSEHLLKSERLDVVDALRGFALLAIVLLHNLEHYNIYHIPEGLPDWLLAFDKGLLNLLSSIRIQLFYSDGQPSAPGQ